MNDTEISEIELNSSTDDLILDISEFPLTQHFEANENEQQNDSYNRLNVASHILDDNLNTTISSLSEDDDEKNQAILDDIDIPEEDMQWNERTWCEPETNNTYESILNVSLDSNSSIFDNARKRLMQHTLVDFDFNDTIFTPKNESFPRTFSHTEDVDFFNNTLGLNKINEQTKNNDFYGLPNKVHTLLEKIRNIDKLYDWQHECLNLQAVKERKNLIYALPTSGGKTLVAEILMLREIVCNKRNVIFILPYVAIVQEKIQSMAPFALELEFLLEEYAGGRGKYPPIKRHRKNSIYICTIEKASGLLNSLIELQRLHEIGLVVVDELHLIGESGGRGATLEGLLTKLIYTNENIHIVGMSATIGNLEEIAKFLKAHLYTQNFRPVQLNEYVKCEDRIWRIDLKTADMFVDEKKINYNYSMEANRKDPDKIAGLVMDVVPKDSCLIFCSSRRNCENVALLLTKVLCKKLRDHNAELKVKLMSALKAEGSVCTILSKTVQFGVAYHHSGLTVEERRLLEEAFRDGTICVICCTSTLAAGVNLPARRVILRSPYMGRDFLNLSRYKQMIGRAGRAGMGEIGESILVCTKTDKPKVRDLLQSKMEDCISTLCEEKDRGMNNLILTAVMLSLATTRSKLHELVSLSLLGVQAPRLNLEIKNLIDETIINLMKDGVLKIDDDTRCYVNTTISIESQMLNDSTINIMSEPKKPKRSISLKKTSTVTLSSLGKAAMKGCIDLKTAFVLYEDLKLAQRHLILESDFHVLYLVTPYDVTACILESQGPIFYNEVIRLSTSLMGVEKLLKIDEAAITKIHNGVMPKDIDSRVINRFYVTLILYELWQQQPLHSVALKYKVDRGLIQNLLINAASFATAIARFCQELPEFWAFTELFTTFGRKLTYGPSAELEILMELPAVKIARAKQLYNAGYKTLQSIASADPRELQMEVKHLSRKTIDQMIAAAHVLLMAKVENLKDEAAEMIEGLETSIRSFR